MTDFTKKIVDAASAAADFSAIVVLGAQAKLFAVQAVFSKTLAQTAPKGVLKLQGSLDGVNFVDIEGTSETIADVGTVAYTVSDFAFGYLKTVFTADGSPGEGSCSVYFGGKV